MARRPAPAPDHALQRLRAARARTSSTRRSRSAGFDAERDIRAITVNRWPHGYAYSPGLLWEPEWKSEAEKPWVIGRQPFGRIAIANSDAGARADTNGAITQAFRAVQETLNG